MSYIIAEYAYDREAWEYVSEIGATPDDTWTTRVPHDYKGDEARPPFAFTKKVDAQRILDTLRAARLAEWEKNSHIYKIYGRRKPVWKIYRVDTT
jgi:hypothetical protein